MDAASSGACRSKSARVVQLRWSTGSMSQRLEEIVAQLMRPIRDLKQNFFIDLSLLEEYLTEVGVRHLDGGPEGFATIAMLVQQCAAIYGKKVDFYEQSVYNMVDHTKKTSSSQEEAGGEVEPGETPTGRKRKRRHSEAFRDFAPIELEPAPNINRELDKIRPPPTLPKTYIEFERTPITERDARLKDYLGNEIGVVNDFHVNWNLKDGLLVDDLDSSAAISREMVRPVITAVLDELRRLSPPTSGSDSGIECSHLEQQDDNDQKPPTAAEPPVDQNNINEVQKIEDQSQIKEAQKRKADAEPRSKCKKKRSLELRRRKALERNWKGVNRLNGNQCSFEGDYVLDMYETKMQGDLLGLYYRSLRMLASNWDGGFLGFSHGSAVDCASGMRGFSSDELHRSRALASQWLALVPEEYRPAHARTKLRGLSDSEDDGFFESSSHEETELSGTDLTQLSGTDLTQLSGTDLTQDTLRTTYIQTGPEREALSTRVEAWHALVAPRVAAAETRAAFDVHTYSGSVLRRLPEHRPQQFSALVSGVEQHDFCRYFLATLFLANTGNVEILQTAAPLEVDSFDVRLLTSERSLYTSVNPME